MERECRIGCLAWWAGLWWLALGSALHGLAWGAFYARDGVTWATYRLSAGAKGCFARAITCAREGIA
jgi:hypothetical protein